MTKFRKLKLQELNRISPDEFKKSKKIPLIVILDNIRSLHNIGSVFRTADAFKVQEIWLTGFTAIPPHREIHKTALGATETVEWKYFEDAQKAIKELTKIEIDLYPIEQSENSTMLQDVQIPDTGMAIVFGNEVDGVTEDFMVAAKEVIEIPQEGTKHSLNVSVSAGIVIWEVFKKLKSTF